MGGTILWAGDPGLYENRESKFRISMCMLIRFSALLVVHVT